MREVIRIALFTLVLFAAACATAQEQAGPRKDRNRISLEEIQAINARNAYELVQGLRPRWLITRNTSMQLTSGRDAEGATTVLASPEIQVYLDGARIGTHKMLRDLSASSISEMRFLNARDATLRFGTEHNHGAILITTRQ